MFRHSHSPHWSILIFAVVWTAVAVTFWVYPWYKDRAVAARQQLASGTIVAHEPSNHDRYGYTFSVNQKTYSGWQVPYNDVTFTVGQVVTVHYDPLDPNNNALVDLTEFDGVEGPVLLLFAAIPFVVLIEFLRRRAKPKSTGVISGNGGPTA
jgi:uncharacterized protein DUF3592